MFRKSHNYEEHFSYDMIILPRDIQKRGRKGIGKMPQNKRESLIYTVIMCFVMVLWMSIYNVALQYGRLDLEVIAAGWLGFPIAYVVGMCCDWFIASRIAKGVAFRYLVKPQDPALKKIICISGGMVVCMVILMSLYGACEMAFHTGAWNNVPMIWLANIPRNFIMALPFQFLIAGPLVRRVFRAAFPEGKVLA